MAREKETARNFPTQASPRTIAALLVHPCPVSLHYFMLRIDHMAAIVHLEVGNRTCMSFGSGEATGG